MKAHNHKPRLLIQLVFLLSMGLAVTSETLNNQDPAKDHATNNYAVAVTDETLKNQDPDKGYTAGNYAVAVVDPQPPSIDFYVRTYNGLQRRIDFEESRVYAYPSLGGQISAKVTGVELSWLGLSATSANETMIDDMAQEDAFALRLLQIGGKWHPNKRLTRETDGLFFEVRYQYKPRRLDLDVGYLPDGGILLLKTLPGRPHQRIWPYADDDPEILSEKPRDYARLDLCTTMEERCAVLRDFGATYYPSIEDCTDKILPRTLKEGIAQGKSHARRLIKTYAEFGSLYRFKPPAAVVQQSVWSSIMRFAGMGRAF
jgi:hypothetical protein